MNRQHVVQNFLHHMNFFRKDEMDNFFSLHHDKFEFNKLAEFNNLKAFKNLIFTSILMSVVITAFIFTRENLDTIAKLICAILFSSFASIINICFTANKINQRFKFMKNESFDQLNLIKNHFFYNLASNNAIFQHIPNSIEFYGEERFIKIKKDCEICAMTTNDLYFILSCIDNESNIGFFFTVKNYIIKIKNFKFNGFRISNILK